MKRPTTLSLLAGAGTYVVLSRMLAPSGLEADKTPAVLDAADMVFAHGDDVDCRPFLQQYLGIDFGLDMGIGAPGRPRQIDAGPHSLC